MEKCNCYRERIVTRYNKVFGKKDYLESYCLGTKECDLCNCGGDQANCDFYEYIRERAKKMMNTAEMWLKAKEDGKTYVVDQGIIAYSKEKGLFYTQDNSLCGLMNFKDWSFDCFMNLQWEAMPEKTMTKVEAEKQLGVKIVG